MLRWNISMVVNYNRIAHVPNVVQALTGRDGAVFAALVAAVLPRFHAAERERRNRQDRRRAIGGGPTFTLEPIDQVLLTIVRLEWQPTYEALGALFGVSTATALRIVARIKPLLLDAGYVPLPRAKARLVCSQLAQVVRTVPELRVLWNVE